MSFTPFVLDTSPSFSINEFRSGFKNGLARPSQFHFILKRHANIFLKTPENNDNSGINKLANDVATGIGYTASGLLGDSYGLTDTVLSNAETIYETLKGRGIADLVLKASKVSIPDRVIDSYTTKTYGPSFQFPREIENSSIVVTFLTSGTYWEHSLMSDWSTQICSYNSTKSSPSFNVCYYDDAVTDAIILCYDEEGSPSYQITLEELWPVSVGGWQADWGDKDSIVEFAVAFNFRIMKTEKIALSIKTNSFVGQFAQGYGEFVINNSNR